jgi:hypothetical protein
MKKKNIFGIFLVSLIILVIPAIPAAQIDSIKKTYYSNFRDQSLLNLDNNIENNIKTIHADFFEIFLKNNNDLKLGRISDLLWLIAWAIITFFGWTIVLMVGFIGLILEIGGLYLLLAVVLNILGITPF